MSHSQRSKEKSRKAAQDWWDRQEVDPRQYTPETRARSNAALLTPEAEAKRLASRRTPEFAKIVSEKVSPAGAKAIRGSKWITNGTDCRRLLSGETMPVGWHFGRGSQFQMKARRGAAALDRTAPAYREAQRAGVIAWWKKRKEG